jgi:hypothetical protein
MKFKTALALIVCLGLLAGSSANASLSSFDFNAQGFVDGQLLEGSVFGLATLTSEGSNLMYTSGYGGGLHSSYSDFIVQADGDIYFNFSSAVSDFWFRGGDGGGDVDAFSLTLYEFGTDNLLGTFTTPLFDLSGDGEAYTLITPMSNIGRVVFDPGNSGILPGIYGESGGVVAQAFGYATQGPAIPEPATMLLFGLGLAGMGLFRRRRH